MKNHLLEFALFLSFALSSSAALPAVTAMRVPNGGIQPQLALDSKGGIHLIYFKGDAQRGDCFYIASTDGGASFSKPIRVNSQTGSVVAAGTVRGPQMAMGRGDRPQVVWMGSADATPRAPGEKGGAPLLYSRLDDARTTFEPQRNLIAANPGLDGGLSIATDSKSGHVYAIWHAPEQGSEGEGTRKVWVAVSTDEGKTFAPEIAANSEPTGLCGCCGMRAFVSREGALWISYRSAFESVNRDTYLLLSTDRAKRFTSLKLDPMKMNTCLMSTTMLVQQSANAGGSLLAAWETSGKIFFAKVSASTPNAAIQPIAAPMKLKPAKHPAIATNAAGQTLLAWTEGTGWKKGGSIAWQVYDREGRAVAGSSGGVNDLQAWSLPAAFARPDGSFVIVY